MLRDFINRFYLTDFVPSAKLEWMACYVHGPIHFNKKKKKNHFSF